MEATMNAARRIGLVPILALALVAAIVATIPGAANAAGPPVFINEIHYDNTGTDSGEGFEIAGPAGTDLAGWTVELYNGSNNQSYNTIALSGTIPNQQAGFGTLAFTLPTNGLQNGSPDGLALVDAGSAVVEFLSYEGSFTAGDGPANGMASTDIGVSETSSTPVGDSLQLTGTGTMGGDFSWAGSQPNTFGNVNSGQTFSGGGGFPLVVDCGAALVVTAGDPGAATVTASDGDDTIATMTVVADTVTPVGRVTDGTFSVGDPSSLEVLLADDAEVGDFTATIEAKNGSGDMATCNLTIIVEAPVAVVGIHEIQGDGQFSPLVGQTVETSGVVTLIDASGSDAWIQTPDLAVDGDSGTSEGIFIDDFNSLAGPPAIGDLITVQGEVEEQQFGTALPRTRLDDTVLISNSGAGSTVTPVTLTDLPNELLSEGISFWEALEGMLVEASDGVVVAPTSRFGEFGFLVPADTAAGSGYFSSINQIILRDLGANAVDYNPERILVDDDALDTPDVTPGDTVNSLLGVVDYTFGAFKLQLRELSVSTNPIPTSPVSSRDPDTSDDNDAERAVITTYNVENLFDLFVNPNKGNQDAGSTPSAAALETQLAKLAQSIEVELLLPEIMVLQEVENTFIAQELGNRVNASAGTNYIATSFETSDARGIEVAFLWDADRVSLLDTFQLSGADVEAAYGPASPSPGREPLYGKFQIGGDVVHIVGNHFKSKGGDDPPFGVNDPFIRVTEVQRKLQAQVVRDFVDTIFASDGDALVMVTGDLNDFPFGEPGEGPDHPVAIVAGTNGPNPLTNLVFEEPEDEQWSFIFDGNSQVLDHMLVSDSLAEKLVGADFLHFNVRYPAGLGGDAGTTVRASDHDPFEGRFLFDEGVDQPDDKQNNRNVEARFSTYNASLNRFNAGDLITDLTDPNDLQAAAVAEIIQRTRPDVLLVNEFDFDAEGVAAGLFQDTYLSVSQGGALPIHYPYRYVAASNTGIDSGFDLDNNGFLGQANDAFGFGFFEGQFAFVVYSMYPIDVDNIRTFQNFLWKDMPGNLIPTDFYDDEELDVFRLSSKNHVDVPIDIGKRTVHFLVSHPTPPVFDGPEDRNGTRNHDEIRFWADYIQPGQSGYIYDDDGNFGGLDGNARFVIAGDQNSDPLDGDSIPGAIQQLLDHPKVNTKVTPASPGGTEQAALQGGANAAHLSDPAFDTADFSDSAPGNLRADYVLPRKNMKIVDAGVFWPLSTDPLFPLVGTFPFPSSDHRLVWIDVRVN